MKIPQYRCFIRQSGTIELPVKEFRDSAAYTPIADMLGFSTRTSRGLGLLHLSEGFCFVGYHEMQNCSYETIDTIIAEILMSCAEHNTDRVLLLGNNPGGPAIADDADLDFYEDLRDKLQAMGVDVFDYAIAAGDGNTDVPELMRSTSCLIMSSLRFRQRHPEEAERRLQEYLKQHPEEREKYERETIMPVENAHPKENLFR